MSFITHLKHGEYEQGTIVVPGIEVVFPKIFRGIGFLWKDRHTTAPCFRLPGVDTQRLESDRSTPAPFFYTFWHTYPSPIAVIDGLTLSPISHLSPEDAGLLVVRYHGSLESLEGYIEAERDRYAVDLRIMCPWTAFQTPIGCFSVVHRRPVEGEREHTIVYCAKIPDPSGGPDVDWLYIVDHRGEIAFERTRTMDDLQERALVADLLRNGG